MKRLVLFAAVLIGLSVAGPLWAADSTKAEIPMMAVGAPPEMKQMVVFEGTWDVAMQMRMSAEAPWTETKGVCVYKMVLDGCALEQTMTADVGGMAMTGTGLTCFNRGSGKWQTSWIDNLSAGMSLYEGDFKDGRLVVSGVDKMPGMTMLSRITTYNITPTKFDWLAESSFDNGATWVETMKGLYTKR
ncbi:MAG: DUF1579 domain-containing protein [candidate division Zixibacteria bacterium]|nr:DUF1579 domain-containing protein [candidate division Zixibacteria bacterium]